LAQTLGIVEAMKTMNEVEAPANGEIIEILVENGQPIEFGQVLMRLQPE
jgi:acetyl-CoA carboxylase biotin carboxyl carrier protein